MKNIIWSTNTNKKEDLACAVDALIAELREAVAVEQADALSKSIAGSDPQEADSDSNDSAWSFLDQAEK